MTNELTEAKVLEMFGEGFDCSQVVLSYFADELELNKIVALKIASPFGGGMWKGETCGAVIGALMVLGIKYGHYKANDLETKNNMLAKKAEFEKSFMLKHKSFICREILGHDLSTNDGMEAIRSGNLLAKKCPKVVLDAINTLKEIL